MYDVIVVGAGPAGASAALFAAKAGLKTLVIDDDKGMTKRAWVENHYGVPAIGGPELVETGKKQAAKFGAELVEARASGVAREGDAVVVRTESGATYSARHVILATGASVELAEASGIRTRPGTEPRIRTVLDVDPQGRTNVSGVWAAGTCAGVSVHTIITAGDGAKVAINVISELKGQRHVDHDVLQPKG